MRFRATLSAVEGFVRTPMRLAIVLLLAAGAARAIQAQIAGNPMPARIVKRGLAVEIKDLFRLPDKRGIRTLEQDGAPAGWARVG